MSKIETVTLNGVTFVELQPVLDLLMQGVINTISEKKPVTQSIPSASPRRGRPAGSKNKAVVAKPAAKVAVKEKEAVAA